MNRLKFIQTSKSVLLGIPLFSLLDVGKLGTLEGQKSAGSPAHFFPDKENFLVEATCVFATPGWGDGKNGDDSWLNVDVDVECYDNLYSAKGNFRDSTEIETNVVRGMPIGFTGNQVLEIFFDGVKNVNIIILGNKRNQDHVTHDKWNIRWEFFMRFKKGNILCTGSNDPAIEYEFSVDQTPINLPPDGARRKSYFRRAELLDHRTLIAGAGIG